MQREHTRSRVLLCVDRSGTLRRQTAVNSVCAARKAGCVWGRASAPRSRLGSRANLPSRCLAVGREASQGSEDGSKRSGSTFFLQPRCPGPGVASGSCVPTKARWKPWWRLTALTDSKVLAEALFLRHGGRGESCAPAPGKGHRGTRAEPCARHEQRCGAELVPREVLTRVLAKNPARERNVPRSTTD